MTGLLHYDTYAGEVGTAPDSTIWTPRTGNWRPGTQVYDTTSAVLDGLGHLAITADRTETGFRSARIDTRGKLDFVPPVRIRASIKMPTDGQGIVPAFWTLGDNPADPGNWPECGEIDIVEYQSNHPVQTSGTIDHRYASITIHGPSLTNPTVDKPHYQTNKYGTVRALGKSDLRDDFHLYDLIWKTDRMIFSIDGAVQWDLKKADYTAAGGDWTPFSGAWSHYLILNVAVNTGMTPNATIDSPFPASMFIDWIRVDSL